MNLETYLNTGFKDNLLNNLVALDLYIMHIKFPDFSYIGQKNVNNIVQFEEKNSIKFHVIELKIILNRFLQSLIRHDPCFSKY